MLRLCRPSPHLVSLCRVNSILAWVSSHELVFELKTRNCLAFCGFTLLSLFWVPSLGNGAPAWVFAVWNLFTRAKQLMRRSDKPVSGSPSTQPSITSLLLPPLASEKSSQQGRAREGGEEEKKCVPGYGGYSQPDWPHQPDTKPTNQHWRKQKWDLAFGSVWFILKLWTVHCRNEFSFETWLTRTDILWQAHHTFDGYCEDLRRIKILKV